MNRKQLHTQSSPTSELASDGLQPFTLVILHVDNSAASASENIILRLLTKCLPRLDVHKDEWSSAELAHPEFAREALELAATCDMLVVAATEDQPFPLAVSSWLATCMEQRASVETAFVWVVASEEPALERSPVQAYFQELAGRHGLSFFATRVGAQAAPKPVAWRSTDLDSRSLLYEPHPDGWGINE